MKKYLAFGEVIETDINFEGELPQSTAETTLRVVQKTFTEKSKELTKVYRAGVQATFSHYSDFDILGWEGIVKYKISDSEIAYELLGADKTALKIFTLSEALGIVLLRRGYFPLHGSSVLIDNAVHVFIGEPGAGKSTTASAFWQAGCTILSDDLTAIKFSEIGPVVQSGIPTLKVWQDALTGLRISTEHLKKSTEGSTKYLVQQPTAHFPTSYFPLHSITYLLEPDTAYTEEFISPIKAPTELLKHFPLPDQLLKGEFIKKHFEESVKLATSVPITYLNRPQDFSELNEFVRSRIK